MALERLNSRRRSLISQIGRAGLNALYPKEFEYYFFALELVNSRQETIDFFAFPVLPSQITEVQPEITNVRKTMGGVDVHKNPTFVPRTLTINGDFGRRFRILVNTNQIEFAGLRFSVNNGVFRIGKPGDLLDDAPVFSSFAKTGYGCIKVIEAMKEKSKSLDQFNQPHSLYCYNPVLGNNYQVEFQTFTHMQDKQQYNVIPRYSIEMIAVAPLEALPQFNDFSLVRNLAFGNIQKRVNNVVSQVRRSIGI